MFSYMSMVLLWLYFAAETYVCKKNNANYQSSVYCQQIVLFEFDPERKTTIEQYLLGVLSFVISVAFLLIFSWVYVYQKNKFKFTWASGILLVVSLIYIIAAGLAYGTIASTDEPER